jgi:hypothetical protein
MVGAYDVPLSSVSRSRPVTVLCRRFQPLPCPITGVNHIQAKNLPHTWVFGQVGSSTGESW